MLGAGTLQDLSLSLFVGILVGMFGTLFVSAPLYASLRLGEAQIREHTARVESGSFKDADAEDADEAEGDSSEEPAEAEKDAKSEESAKAEGSKDSAEGEKAAEKPAKKPARATIEIHRVNLNG